jgi:hypothetical protein
VRDVEGRVIVKTEASGADLAAARQLPAPAAVAPVAHVEAGDSLGNMVMLKLLERVLPAATPQTAGQVLEQSFQIADRLRPAAPVRDVDEIVESVVARLRPVAVAPAGGIAGELETWERVNAVLDKVGAGRALDGGGPAWLGPLLDSLVRPLVPVLIGFLSRPAVGASNGAVAGSVTIPAAPAVSTAPESPAAPPLPVLLPASAPLMERVIQVAQLALDKSAAGVTGFIFAQWVVAWYPGGEEVYKFLEGHGAGGCLTLMNMIPAMQVQLSDPVRVAALEAWLEDFFSLDVSAEVMPAAAGAGASVAA